MEPSASLAVLSPPPNRLERWVQRPGVQRWAAIALAFLGLAGAVVHLAMLAKVGPDLAYARGSALAYSMVLIEEVMVVALILVSGGLGLFLALRGYRQTLTRVLALSCGFVSSLFGMVSGTAAAAHVLDPAKHAHAFGWIGLGLGAAIAVTFFFGFFGVLYFLALYPKPVRFLGMEFGDGANPFQARMVTRWTWSWFASPQFAALAAGAFLIVLLGNAIDLTWSRINISIAYYAACWLPFAAIAAKQPLLGEDDRRTVKWVFLGQAIWLVAFLATLLTVWALVRTGTITFASWNHSAAFATGFFTFFFSGFVLVLLATLAISIFHHGTFDPDLLIRRTWVIAVAGLVFGGLFVVLERLLAEAVAAWLDISTANALTVVAAITAGVVYPLRSALEQRIRTFIERWRAAQAIADGIRQQAAIVFADLSGYTALTEADEREALIMAAVFHRDAQQLAAAHDGKLVKTIGDAVLLRFKAADQAFFATRELKRRFSEHIRTMGMTPLPIHAGIHYGEVVEAPSGDVFGSTVNIAARLLGTAGAEEIVASRSAVEAARHPETHFLGGKKLKNIENPVDCFLLAAQA